jgi:opacity protein-like surface antigen
MVAKAQAQSSAGGPLGGFSMYTPGTAYIGLNIGRSDFQLGRSLGAFPFDSEDTSYNVYGGSFFSNNLGVEIGLNDFGKIARGGRTTKAMGLNTSLVGRLPVTQQFNLMGRLGTTYGHTDVSASPLSGLATGSESGFGLAYGVGVEYAFNPKLAAVLQYDEHNLKFVGSGREKINVTSVGLKYRF